MAKPNRERGGGESAAEGARLPAGRHGLPREFVAENQRERLITALAEVVAKQGFQNTTIADITKAAAVSRRTFYEQFSSKEDCFLATYELVVNHVRSAMMAAASAYDDWPQGVRAALATMLRFLASEPDLARLCIVEPLTAGEAIATRHRQAMQDFVAVLKERRPERTDPRPLPETTEEALVGGVASLIAKQINAGKTEQLEELLPDLVALVLTPYVGGAEAERVAQAG